MDLQADPKAVRYCLTVSRHAGTAVIVVGVLVLAGWLLDVKQLTTLWWGFATMKPNTALCLVLLGISLRLEQTSAIQPSITNRTRRLIGEIVAGSAALVGLLSGAEYLLRRDLGIDELLIHGALFSTAGTHPARMSTTSVVAVVAFGLSILCLDSKSTWAARLSTFAIASRFRPAIRCFKSLMSLSHHTSLRPVRRRSGSSAKPSHSSLPPP